MHVPFLWSWSLLWRPRRPFCYGKTTLKYGELTGVAAGHSHETPLFNLIQRHEENKSTPCKTQFLVQRLPILINQSPTIYHAEQLLPSGWP